MYNFQVEDYHTYYVGENSVLVHNDCENPVIDNMESRVPDSEVEIPNKRGNAPTSKKDGKPIEIHHDEQNPNGPFKEMHPSDHRYGENYKKNHFNYNQKSKVDRTQFRKWKNEYWNSEWDNGRWK
ncbi:intein C-terminal splicing region [Anaerosporobacter mobilis DSM 15930]|uniref:Intein C-terminal splicing region n=1 Tax=Anaerosporobacter mobilis DSM 15930 TaxID=1120996 RepID=A0A1M7NGG5_9FIRM|nr:HNH/ENDO VII family nuclease [Anaerosporobacter mobilis]SHN02816.1 intein C-terminal splicing region [Anaerosporobacter mobilis DSM 15930]